VQTLFIVYFCLRKRKKENKVLLPTGVSKPVAHTVQFFNPNTKLAEQGFNTGEPHP
jgi:hypothetical protein